MTHPETNRFITRRRVMQCALAGVATLCLPQLATAQTWQGIAAIRDRVGDAQLSNETLLVTLPLVAEDGSAVPLTIKSSLNSNGPSIRRLAIFAPGNPTPQVAEFEFGLEIETLNLTTRIRLSESQTVIAVAHTDDGRVLIAERDVRVTTSGCIAPGQPDSANEMKARVRVPKTWKQGNTGEVLTMITHPMTTGLAADATGSTPPQRIIKTFNATLDHRPLIRATYHRSLSMNPYLRFDVTPRESGELRFKWTEDTGRVIEHKEKLALAVPNGS
ncbi:thiosulfate oxidation carrier protein SoxY [Pollutimonas subterranea]|uniref:thiosulfate oxidation carrier protein SoxY n=1 Tax=Pollutimonas subterranea TaxID=2045210 RepID=UPI001303FA2D|nr:thiosulfate oxidation carrier protein SoxY [Pollutimonas subterranea]